MRRVSTVPGCPRGPPLAHAANAALREAEGCMQRWPGGAQSPAASARPHERRTSKQRVVRAGAALSALSLVEPELA